MTGALERGDLSENAVTEQLRAGGATVYEGHRAEQIAGAELLVMSTAITGKRPGMDPREKARRRAAGSIDLNARDAKVAKDAKARLDALR